MASQIKSPAPPAARPRLQRWLMGGAVVTALLAGYAVALHQLSEEVGAGVEASLRELPAVEDQHHGAGD